MTVVQELYPGDLDRLAPHLEVAMNAFPCFQEAEIQVKSGSIYILKSNHKAVTITLKIFFDKNPIQSVVNGPITYTPDLLPMVGPTLLPNMWLAVGFGYGIGRVNCLCRS